MIENNTYLKGMKTPSLFQNWQSHRQLNWVG